MTSANAVPVIFDTASVNLTINFVKMNASGKKQNTVITPPTSTGAADQGAVPKASKIVDLLRITRTFSFTGLCTMTEMDSLISIFNKTVTVWNINGTAYNVSMDSYSFDINANDKQASANPLASPPVLAEEDDTIDFTIQGTVGDRVG